MSFDLCLSQIIHQFFFFLLFMISIRALLIPGVSLLKCKKFRSDENMCPKAKHELRMHPKEPKNLDSLSIMLLFSRHSPSL